MAWKYVLIAANNRGEAAAKVSSYGGIVGVEISSGIYTASVPDTYNEADEDAVTTWLESTASDTEKATWEALKALEPTAVERPVPFTMTGKTAIALLMVNGEGDDQQVSASGPLPAILAGLYNGVSSLQLSYPDDNIEMSFDYHNITISPSSQVPDAGIHAWPSAVPFQDKLYCFFQGKGPNLGKLFYNVFDPSTGEWSVGTQILATSTTTGPSAVVFNNQLYVFHTGNAPGHDIWYNVSSDGTSWAGDTKIYNTRITGGPSVVEFDGKLYCFHQGYTDKDNEFWYNVYDGSTWVGDKMVTGTSISESPSAVVFGSMIFCFYQGVGELANTLLLNRFDPTTEEWSGPVQVPYTNSIANGPSASAFDDKIYVFHQSGDEGSLWFNSSTDGSLWRGDTPLTHMRSTDGLGTTVFDDELYCFYQGVGTRVETLMYRSFAKGSLEWEDVWATPALESLGYGSYAELAEAVREERDADNGYVVCLTMLPLLYNSYADGTRLCIQYPSSEDIGTTFAKIFDAAGVYDRSSDPSGNPRYTFALRSAQDNTIALALYATAFVFHQAAGTNTGTQFYFSLLDRRSGSWTEMQGPVTSSTSGGQNAGVFLSSSKLYVFYQVDENGGELHYNILDGVTWQGETTVPNITGASGSPGVTLYNGKIYCFYQFGSNENGKFFCKALDTSTDTWGEEIQLQLQQTAAGDPNFGCYMLYGPSPAVFMDNFVYNLYNGAVTTKTDAGVYHAGRLRVNEFNGSASITDMQIPNSYLTGEPSAVVFNDILYAFHQGNKSDGTVWYNTTNAVEFWDGDKELTLTDGFLISDGPSAMALDGKLYCFLKGKGVGFADILFYNVLDGSNTWGERHVVPTGSGIGGQQSALAIGSLCISYDTTPPTIRRITS